MDVFSWFRQKRQGPRRSADSNDDNAHGNARGAGSRAARASEAPREIVIPFDAAPTVGFAVYFYHEGDADSLPSVEFCQRAVETWVQNNAREPLREALLDFLRESSLTYLLQERGGAFPDPPDDMIRAYNPGENEERRYRNATHVFFVGATDLASPPRAGFWAVTAAARALAESLSGGVVVDPEFPRLLPLEDTEFPAGGEIRMVQHIVLPYSHEARTGLLWMTSKGMGRFGLPDLEIRDVPPNLAQNLMPVLNGMAQKLMAASARHAAHLAESDDFISEVIEAPGFPCPSEVILSVADISRAYGDEGNTAGSEAAEGDEKGAATRVRLAVSRQRGGDATFIRLLPPFDADSDRTERGSNAARTGVWLNQLLSDLLGATSNLASVQKGDEQMEAAHEKAVETLQQVRTRFAQGFRSGEVLHIKYGFPVSAYGVGPPEPDEDEDGHEFMWVAVTAWSEGGRVRGSLANDPQYRHDLKAGQAVELSEEDIYDWMIVHRDGRMEGAFTNRVLETLDEDGEA